ncbi:MAG: cardiolipin synthase [bacterium]|nr:MAG: cardiolipin synthase [bacterium]
MVAGASKVFVLTVALVLAVWASGHAVLNKRDPRGGTLWIFVIIILPVAGPFLYWIFGINRIHRWGVERARTKEVAPTHLYPSEFLAETPHACVDLDCLQDISSRATGRPLLSGNRIEPLYEGNQVFPAMLEAIGGARRSVTLSTYILDRDAVGIRIIDALCAAANRGCHVRVLVDGFGTSRSALRMALKLRESGAGMSVFHPLLGWLPLRRPGLNLRNHRKILVVDGKVGFTGGINISGRHFFSRYKRLSPVRDIHFRVSGPVVSAMQEVFAEDWLVSTGELIQGPDFFQPPEAKGDICARAVASGPDENFERIYEVVMGAIRSANREILIMTPYFIPTRALTQSLRTAHLAGVDIRIILPRHSDHPLVQAASMAYLEELLETGVSVYTAPPPFLHSKLMIVDRVWSLIGSANLDPRSFRLNFEFDLEVYSLDLAERLMAYGERTLQDSDRIDLKAFTSRPISVKLAEGVAKLFSPYL